MRKMIGLAVLLGLASCSTGRRFGEEDIAKLNTSGMTAAQIQKEYGKPRMEVEATNEGGFYSPKCGKRGDPVAVWTYTGTKMGMITSETEATTVVLDSNRIACKTVRSVARSQ